MMPERDVAMAVIIDVDEYLLEKRTATGGSNGALGKIGCFGGGIKSKETPEQAVWREVVEEETDGLEEFAIEDFRPIGSVHVISDRDGKEVFINAEVFELLLPHGWPLEASGKRELVRLKRRDISVAKAKKELTPATAATFTKLYGI